MIWLFFLSWIFFQPLHSDSTYQELSAISEEEKYSLPLDHPLYLALDTLFSSPETLKNRKSFKNAGFKILYRRPSSMLVASHFLLPGHLIKVHLYTSPRTPAEMWENFINRCKGASQIRQLIREEALQHFTVADKWIYWPPVDKPLPVLLVTDMAVVTKKESKEAWKTLITQEHLDELFSIIKRGFASTSLPSNTPYTKNKLFAFVDTECPLRIPLYDHARAHLSEEMKLYWDKLVYD